jgi:GT2 family glycosyltransferase
MSPLSVSVVIPAWNSLSQLKANLPGVLAASKLVNAQIIVVDDGSTDATIKYLTSLGKQISFFQNPTNLGFAGTVNRGVREAKSDIVILLNTDVKPNINCFVNCLPYFNDQSLFAITFNSKEGYAGGRFRQGLFHHFRIMPNTTQAKVPEPSLFASGGQAAFSRQLWVELGGMDTIYKPFYWEDTDLGYRAWQLGYKILWAPDCQVPHLHQNSVIAAHFSARTIKNVAQRNQFLFIWKNFRNKKLLLAHLLSLPKYLYLYPNSFFCALQFLPAIFAYRRKASKLCRPDQEILSLWQ